MKTMLKKVKVDAVRLLRDERGAEGLEKLLILAAIVLPLLVVLVVFRNKIKEYLWNTWNTTQSDATNFDPNNP
jgi:Flp pilus assembly pilin Flp